MSGYLIDGYEPWLANKLDPPAPIIRPRSERLAEFRADAKREAFLEAVADDLALADLGNCVFCQSLDELDHEHALCQECAQRLAERDLIVCDNCGALVDGWWRCQIFGDLCTERCSPLLCTHVRCADANREPEQVNG